MSKTQISALPIYEMQKQAFIFLYERREYIKASIIERKAKVSKYLIGRAFSRYESKGLQFDALDKMPFSTNAFFKILGVLLFIGLELYKDDVLILVKGNEHGEVTNTKGTAITLVQLIEMYNKI